MPEHVELEGTNDPYDALYEPTPFCEHIRAEGYGFVYFIGPVSGEGPVKIGFAYSVPQRLCELQVGNPAELDIYVAILAKKKTERELHKKFAASRVRGEWFLLTGDVIEEIRRLRTLEVRVPGRDDHK